MNLEFGLLSAATTKQNKVIEPKLLEFIEKMNQIENVDEILIVHQIFLDTSLENCMLKNPELLCAVL